MLPRRSFAERLIRYPGKLVLRWRSARYFRGLRNRFAGQRGFVIGNGPSLAIADLDRIQGEVAIASNKIYLAFEQTCWRPTLHTMMDPLVVQKIGRVVGSYFSATHTCEGLSNLVRGCPVFTFRPLGAATEDPSEIIRFSPDVSRGTYSGWTVTFENLQLAHHLGLNPVYLIGCDHFYQGEDGAKANQTVTHSGASNHFVPNYREKGEVVYAAPVQQMTRAYEHVRAFAERNQWTVCNATRGGFLEVFPRVDFDSLFPRNP